LSGATLLTNAEIFTPTLGAADHKPGFIERVWQASSPPSPATMNLPMGAHFRESSAFLQQLFAQVEIEPRWPVSFDAWMSVYMQMGREWWSTSYMRQMKAKGKSESQTGMVRFEETFPPVNQVFYEDADGHRTLLRLLQQEDGKEGSEAAFKAEVLNDNGWAGFWLDGRQSDVGREPVLSRAPVLTSGFDLKDEGGKAQGGKLVVVARVRNEIFPVSYGAPGGTAWVEDGEYTS
jgi:hypothetical protein